MSTQRQVSSVAIFTNIMQQWSHSLDQILLSHILCLSGKFSFHELCNRRAEADRSNTTFKSQDPKRKNLSNLTSVTISYIQNASTHTRCTIKNKIGLGVQTFANDSLFMTTPCLGRKKKSSMTNVCLPGWRCASGKRSLPVACKTQNQGPGSWQGPPCPLVMNCRK